MDLTPLRTVNQENARAHVIERMLDKNRAAHVAGVNKKEIETLISVGTITMVEGKVLVSELRRVYPDIDLTGAKMVDVVDQIKEDAILKALRIKTGRGISIEDLRHEVIQLRRDLNYFKARSDAFRALCYDLRHKISALEPQVQQKHRITNIVKWLDQKMRKMR